MNDDWLKKWNERYRKPEYAFGVTPNRYLKERLNNYKPGNILFGAEGEGRNAIYAATRGWNVAAFDISQQGKEKAEQLARQHDVSVNYQVGQLPALNYSDEEFDAIALIYAHFPPEMRKNYHHLLQRFLKRNGIVILEAFGKNHLHYREKNPKIGGPRTSDFLITADDILSEFKDLHIIELTEKEVQLSEGLYHNGTGFVTRFTGRKK